MKAITADKLTAAPAPIGLVCLAAILQPFWPSTIWISVGLIVPALVLMWLRLGKIQAMWDDITDPICDEAERDCD